MIQKVKKFKKRETRQTIFFSLFLGFLILIIIGFLIISNWKINQKRVQFQSQIETLRREIQVLEEKKQELEAGISQTKREGYLEKEARERLGLKKPGEEVVAVLPPRINQEERASEEKSFLEEILEKLKFW